MKILKRLLNEHVARGASYFLRIACFCVMAFFIICLVLSLLGRQSFRLHTGTDVYEEAIIAEKDHGLSFRNMTFSGTDDIYICANADGQIEFSTKAALFLTSAFNIIPMIIAYWLLSLVFTNVSRGKIFTAKNAAFLLNYGLLQIFAALFAPLINLLICRLANHFAESQIMISTGGDILNRLFPSIAFLVAAYIIHYGIELQDEVDHTL